MSRLNLENIDISRHAWRQFVRRFNCLTGTMPSCPHSVLKGMLRRAEPEDIGPGAVHRLLDNDGIPVNYFKSDNWRFVTSEDNQQLITVEIRYLGKGNGYRKRRKH